jgi:hypothetical protein
VGLLAPFHEIIPEFTMVTSGISRSVESFSTLEILVGEGFEYVQ